MSRDTRIHGFTGNDLNALRRALVLREDSFAKHMNLKPKLIRKAERFKEKEIPIDGEFRILFENMCYAVPEMVMIRLEHLNSIQNALQALGMKLKRADNFLLLEKKRKERSEDSSEKEVSEEKEERRLSDTATDKRSISTED